MPGLCRWCPTHILRGLLGPEALEYASNVCNTSALKCWRASASALSQQAGPSSSQGVACLSLECTKSASKLQRAQASNTLTSVTLGAGCVRRRV